MESSIPSSPKLLSIHLAPSLYCCLSYSIPGGGLCTYLYEACVSQFLQAVEVPLESSPALLCIVSSSHLDKSVILAEGAFCLIFSKDIKWYLPHLLRMVKQHLHVFSLHYLQTRSSFFN